MSAPNWWGDWRPTLTPHTGNLQPTDLLECTMIVGGLPVNTAITGAQIIAAASGGGGLTVGTTAIASGTDGRVLFQDAGVLQQDASFFWDNTNKRLGVGATPSTAVRLDVRAQGALSTDTAFRVRNSADTANIFSVFGNRSAEFDLNNTNVRYYPSTKAGAPNNYIDIGLATASFTSIKINATHGGSNFAYFEMNANSLNYFTHNSLLIFRANTSPNRTSINLQASGGNVGIGTSTFGTSAINTFTMINATAPSTSPTDQFQLYSADIVAGNAAPHFRTENGDIVKLYRVGGWGLPTGTFTRTTFNTATVTTAQLAERVAALIQDLRDNHQLLKA